MLVVGLVDIGQKGLEGNTAIYRKEKPWASPSPSSMISLSVGQVQNFLLPF
jgi:hypothetical protein